MKSQFAWEGVKYMRYVYARRWMPFVGVIMRCERNGFVTRKERATDEMNQHWFMKYYL